MLKDPKKITFDPILAVLETDTTVKKLGVGMYKIQHFNFNNCIKPARHISDMAFNYPDFTDKSELYAYGVCDTPEQFMAKFGDLLNDDPRSFTVSFTHIEKNPENRGQRGGWRWHKWGPYLGNGKPTTEYLDDEEAFAEGVYVFHIHQIDGPIFKLDYNSDKLVLQ